MDWRDREGGDLVIGSRCFCMNLYSDCMKIYSGVYKG
jgi:hypothetical protein